MDNENDPMSGLEPVVSDIVVEVVAIKKAPKKWAAWKTLSAMDMYSQPQ